MLKTAKIPLFCFNLKNLQYKMKLKLLEREHFNACGLFFLKKMFQQEQTLIPEVSEISLMKMFLSESKRF